MLLGAALAALAVAVVVWWDEIVAVVGQAYSAIEDATRAALGSIRDWFGSAFDWIRDKARAVLDWIAAKLRSIKDAVSSVFSGGSGDTPGFAGGGRVRGPGTATSDSILARLSTGEFVVRARAVQHYGVQVFERLNRMVMPRQLVPGFAGGGLVVPIPAESGAAGGPVATLNLSIGGEVFEGLTAPREVADRLIRFALTEEVKSAGRRPGWFAGGTRYMVTYRTTDAEHWGAGKGSNLTAGEVDTNFWDLLTRIAALETNPAEPNEIASFTVAGSQMTVHMGDGTMHGPLTLPTALIRFRGDWTAATAYFELDLVTVPGDGLCSRPSEAERVFSGRAQERLPR